MNYADEYWRLAQEHADAEQAASLLEETKTAVLSQMMLKLGDMPVTHAERQVKASAEWTTHINIMVEARKKANLLKAKLVVIKMKDGAKASQEATRRAEMRL